MLLDVKSQTVLHSTVGKQNRQDKLMVKSSWKGCIEPFQEDFVCAVA